MKKDILNPGTITLQYINDDCSCVGFVIGDEWAEKKLDKENLRIFQMHLGSNYEDYVCLILGWFPRFPCYGGVFGSVPKIFPSYIAAEKRTATPTTLEKEISFFRHQAEEKISRGLTCAKLGSRIFSLNDLQIEVIRTVATIKQYYLGCPVDKLPKWIGYFEDKARVIYKELDEILPVSDKQKATWKKETE